MFPVEDRRKLTARLSVLQYIVAMIFAALAVSFWLLQVAQHAKYQEMAENNHQRTLALRAPRGLVFDRNGREIVENHRREPSYRPITIVQDASLAQVAAVMARRLDFELPDVIVEQVPTRRYPEAMAAHLFGYVGEVSDRDVSANGELKSGDIVGQS